VHEPECQLVNHVALVHQLSPASEGDEARDGRGEWRWNRVWPQGLKTRQGHGGNRGEVDAKTFREVTAEIDAAHDQLAREHKRLTSEAAMPELPDPSLAWEDLSAEDRRALTELLVDKIVVAPHPHKIVDGRRHYTIRAIPYQDPQQEAERLKAVHEARVKIVPRV
jgi:hypothetical protein